MTTETETHQNKEPTVNIKLTVAELNLVLAGLQEMPHRIVDPVIKKVLEQGKAQLEN